MIPEKIKKWHGRDLEGRWLVTRKLDGVRAIRRKKKIVSRKNKPLFNLGRVEKYICNAEIFCGSLEETIGKVRASRAINPVALREVYELDPPDKRLVIGTITNPTAERIMTMMRMVMAQGDEGLVLRNDDRWLKVKGKRTFDVKVIGRQKGKGKHKGRLGALLTTKGEVGTGLTDKQREEYNTPRIVGCLIEVECTRLTPGGRFRHARFKRVRWDKPGGREFKPKGEA